MKKTSLKSIGIIILISILQIGCIHTNQSPYYKDKATYEQAKKLQDRAEFLRHEGEPDSAIVYYNKSIVLFKELESHVDSATDKLYSTQLAFICNDAARLEADSLDKNKCLTYCKEALKWSNIAHLYRLHIGTERLIGLTYYDMARKEEQDSGGHNILIKEGLKYMIPACWQADSLGWDKSTIKKNYLTVLVGYFIARNLYKELHDTVHEKFYEKKYTDLYFKWYGVVPEN